MEQQLTNEEVFFAINGEEECNTELALSILLREDVLFANSFPFQDPICKTPQPETIVLFVAANDIFEWGLADSESLTYDEVPALFKLWESKKHWGVIEWLCKKRNEQPQFPIKRNMKAAGMWTEELEALPANFYDSRRIKDSASDPTPST